MSDCVMLTRYVFCQTPSSEVTVYCWSSVKSRSVPDSGEIVAPGVSSNSGASFFISTPPTTKACTLLSSIVGSDLSISAGRMQRTMSASVLRGSPLMQELSSNSDRGKMRVKIFFIEEHLNSRSPHSDENGEWSKDNPHGFTFPNKKRKKRTAVTFRSRRRCTF